LGAKRATQGLPPRPCPRNRATPRDCSGFHQEANRWHAGCMRTCALPFRPNFPCEESPLSTDQKGTRILARTFFTQLRASGYTQNQVISIATELLDLVSEDLKAAKVPAESAPAAAAESLRPSA